MRGIKKLAKSSAGLLGQTEARRHGVKRSAALFMLLDP